MRIAAKVSSLYSAFLYKLFGWSRSNSSVYTIIKMRQTLMDSKKKRQNIAQLQAGTITFFWRAVKQRQNAETQFEHSKQSERAVTGVIRCSALVSPRFLKLRLRRPIIFLFSLPIGQIGLLMMPSPRYCTPPSLTLTAKMATMSGCYS